MPDMDSSFVGQQVMVPRETGEPQCGTIVGETQRLFAVVTDIGDVIMVEKWHTYSYDAKAFERIKDVKRKFLEARTSLEGAWAGLVPLEEDPDLHRAWGIPPKRNPFDGEAMEVVTSVASGQLRQEQPEFTFEESDVQPLLEGIGNSWGRASGPVTVVRSVDELSKVKEGDVLVAEERSVTLDWPWFQAAMLASALVVDFGYRHHPRLPHDLSSEVGIPCIRGAREVESVRESGGRVTGKRVATQILTDGQIVTVDSIRGEVYDRNILEV